MKYTIAVLFLISIISISIMVYTDLKYRGTGSKKSLIATGLFFVISILSIDVGILLMKDMPMCLKLLFLIFVDFAIIEIIYDAHLQDCREGAITFTCKVNIEI